MNKWSDYRESQGNDSWFKNTCRYNDGRFVHIQDVTCNWAGDSYDIFDEQLTPKEVLEYLKDDWSLQCMVDSFLVEYPELITHREKTINVILEYFDGIQMTITDTQVKDMLIFMEDSGIYIDGDQ